MKARTWIAGLTSTTLIATVGVVAFTAVPAAVADTPVEAPAGQLVLQTGTIDRLTYVDGNAATTDPTQSIGVTGKCSLSPAAGTLVTWSSTSTSSGVPGFGQDSIGVSSGNKTSGTACSQVNQDAGESVALTLNGTTLKGALGGSLLATSAVLDVEVKSNASITATLFGENGAATGEVFRLYSGGSKVATPGANDFNCNASSDSGPDSGSNDNCRWSFNPSTPFAKVVLRATVGSFSLEGGGDWTGTGTAAASANRSVLDLVDVADGEFCVGETETASFTNPSSGQIGVATVTRLPDGNGNTAGCLYYRFSVQSDGASFRKNPATDLTAQFVVTVERTFTGTIPNPVGPAIRIDWLTPASEIDPITWCPGSLYTDNNGTPEFTYGAINATWDMTGGQPGTQYTCLFKSEPVLNSDGTLTQTDHFYLTGDPKFGGF